MRKLADYWGFIFYATLTCILSIAHVAETPVSVNLIADAFMIPGWSIILVFLFTSIICAFVWIDWKYRAAALLPIVIYSTVAAFVYITQANWIIGLLSGHLYGGVAVTMIIQMATLHDNHKIRCEQQKLLGDIEQYRNELGANASEPAR